MTRPTVHGWMAEYGIGDEKPPRAMARPCVANPYFTGWWATVGAGQLAHMAPRTKGEYVAFYAGHEASDYAWYLIVAALILGGRRWLSDSVYQYLVLFCGVALVALGLRFLATGIRLTRRSGSEPPVAPSVT